MFTWLFVIATLTTSAVVFGPDDVGAAALGAAKILVAVLVLLGAIAFVHRGRPGTRAASLVRRLSTVRPRTDPL